MRFTATIFLLTAFVASGSVNYLWRGTYWDDLSQPRARVHF
jgi:hypothetical protein